MTNKHAADTQATDAHATYCHPTKLRRYCTSTGPSMFTVSNFPRPLTPLREFATGSSGSALAACTSSPPPSPPPPPLTPTSATTPSTPTRTRTRTRTALTLHPEPHMACLWSARKGPNPAQQHTYTHPVKAVDYGYTPHVTSQPSRVSPALDTTVPCGRVSVTRVPRGLHPWDTKNPWPAKGPWLTLPMGVHTKDSPWAQPCTRTPAPTKAAATKPLAPGGSWYPK